MKTGWLEDRINQQFALFFNGTRIANATSTGLSFDSAGLSVSGAVVDVRTKGAKGDGQTVSDGATVAGSRLLTSATGSFVATDVGKHITVEGAAAHGGPLATTIAAYVSATSVLLTTAATKAVSNAEVVWGTDDSDALDDAIEQALTWGGSIEYPEGIYCVTTQGSHTGDAVTIPYALKIGGSSSAQRAMPVRMFSRYGATIRLLQGEEADTVNLLIGNTSAARRTGRTTIEGIKFHGGSQYDASGTATAGGSNTLTDSGQAWTTNAYAAGWVRIVSGTGAGQIRNISSNTGTQLTVSSNWSTQPSTDSVYRISMYQDFGLITGINCADLTILRCEFTAWNFAGVHILRNCYGARVERSYFDQSNLGPSGSTSLRGEVNGIQILWNRMVADALTGQGHLSLSDNADVLLQAKQMLIMGNELHGGPASGAVIDLNGVSNSIVLANLIRDVCASSSVCISVSHYTNANGTVYGALNNQVLGNQLFNVARGIQLTGNAANLSWTNSSGSGSSFYVAGAQRTNVMFNTINITTDAIRTQFGTGTSYPVAFPQAPNATTATLTAGIFESNTAGVSQNMIAHNLVHIDGNGASRKAVTLYSPTTVLASNYLFCTGGAAAIDNLGGAALTDNTVIGVATASTNVLVNNVQGVMTGNRIYDLSRTDTSHIAVKNTNGNLRMNYIYCKTGIAVDNNSSTYGVVDDTNIILAGGPPEYSLTGLAAPSNAAGTGATTGGTLAAATYGFKVTTIDQDGLESAPTAEFTATVASGTTGSVSATWDAVSGAASYNFYGNTSGGPWLLITNRTTNSYTYTGAATISATRIANAGSTWGSIQMVRRTTVNDAAYTAKLTDHLIAYTALSAGRTVTLPAPSSCTNQIFIVKDEAGAANTHNITVDGGDGNIDGASTKTISANYGKLAVYSDGTNWFTLDT